MQGVDTDRGYKSTMIAGYGGDPLCTGWYTERIWIASGCRSSVKDLQCGVQNIQGVYFVQGCTSVSGFQGRSQNRMYS